MPRKNCSNNCLTCELPKCLLDEKRQKKAERNHEYYLKHKEEINKRDQERYVKNREERLRKAKEHYWSHREEISERRKLKRRGNKVGQQVL